MKISHVICVSDIHAGCQFALCPPEGVTLDGGGRYIPSDMQLKIYQYWRIFWDEWVPKVTKGEPYAVVVNGDAIDGSHHNSTSQISHNLADQNNIAYELLAPIADNAEKFFMIRGTPVHVGESGQDEERLAKRLGAIPNDVGNYARFDMWLKIGDGDGCLINFNHHIGTTSRMAYESSAPMAELSSMYAEAGRWQDRPPDVVIRCLSDDTELLTRNGWKGMNDVNVGDDVMTLNTFTDELQWQTSTEKVINENEPEMIRMTGKGMDICVTPDHTMVVRTKSNRWGSNGWKPELMQSIYDKYKVGANRNGTHYQIPVAGFYKGVPVDLTPDQLWMIGFIMADGSWVKDEHGKRYAARVHQLEEKTKEVESKLKLAGIRGFTNCMNVKAGTPHFDSRKSRYVYTRRNCLSWYIPKEYALVYINNLDKDKCLPQHMMEMTAEQFKCLLAGFHYGDGCKSQNRLYNVNEKMLNQLQELMVKHGYKSNLHYKEAYTTKRNIKKRVGCINFIPDCHAIGIGQKKKHQIETIKWNKQSWCVTVPNHTLVIRRNGCVSIVGNSHRHRHIKVQLATKRGYGIVEVTPAWQLKTPFVYKIPGGRVSTPQIGGIFISAGDEEHYTRNKVWSIDRSPTEVI